MFKCIALDIGGVCIRLDIEKALQALGYADATDIPMEFIAATDMLEKGMMTEADWLTVFQEITGKNFSGRELRDAWAMIIGETIPGMPELARELTAAGYKLVFFSDTSEIHMQEVYRNLSFANLVTGCISSVMKSAPKSRITQCTGRLKRNTANPYFMPTTVPLISKAGGAAAGIHISSLPLRICGRPW